MVFMSIYFHVDVVKWEYIINNTKSEEKLAKKNVSA